MTRMQFGIGFTALALLASTSHADNPQVDAIHAQIKALRAEKSQAIKQIHAWYTQFIKRDKFTNEVLVAERKNLKAEEDAMLSMVTDAQAREAIRSHYESLRGLLRLGSALDKSEIAKLEHLRKAHEQHVSKVYEARIDVLEAAAKAAAKKPKK